MMPTGECIITLQDIIVIVVLPVDGDAVIDQSNVNWMLFYEELLRLLLPINITRESSLLLVVSYKF